MAWRAVISFSAYLVYVGYIFFKRIFVFMQGFSVILFKILYQTSAAYPGWAGWPGGLAGRWLEWRAGGLAWLAGLAGWAGLCRIYFFKRKFVFMQGFSVILFKILYQTSAAYPGCAGWPGGLAGRWLQWRASGLA